MNGCEQPKKDGEFLHSEKTGPGVAQQITLIYLYAPYENAIAERVNGTLKAEYGLEETFKDYLAANEAVKTAVYKYNNKRPHASCNFMAPVEAHSHKGELMKRWTKRVFQLADNFIETQS
jgi:hypothetical protein